MSRNILLKEAQKYREAKNELELNKPEAVLFSIDGKYNNLGTAAYYPDEDIIRLGLHSLRIRLDKSARDTILM